MARISIGKTVLTPTNRRAMREVMESNAAAFQAELARDSKTASDQPKTPVKVVIKRSETVEQFLLERKAGRQVGLKQKQEPVKTRIKRATAKSIGR
jgi:hypothetical protein